MKTGTGPHLLEECDPPTVLLLQATVMLIPPGKIGGHIDWRREPLGEIALHHAADEAVHEEGPGDH